MHLKKSKLKNNFFFPIIIALFCSLFFLLPWPVNDFINDSILDIQFKIRGNRQLSDDFLFVFVGQEDINDLGGWPLTRDYFGYLTYIINQSGAKVIGIDLLFDRSSRQFPEYDEFLADIFQGVGNVCLPMIFAEISEKNNQSVDINQNHNSLLEGLKPVYPIDKFIKVAAGIGFSNLGKASIIRKMPLVVNRSDSFIYSFGVEMSKLYFETTPALRVSGKQLIFDFNKNNNFQIPLNKNGQIRLNHFGDLNQVQKIGMLDLLQFYDKTPDSLNLKGKMVVIGATLPGETNLKATPLNSSIPASLLHLTCAENIIKRTYLRDTSFTFHLVLIILLITTVTFLWKIPFQRWIPLSAVAVMILFLVFTQFLFCNFHMVVHIFYPFLALLLSYFYEFFSFKQVRRKKHISLKNLLEQQLKEKESELLTARQTLAESQKEVLESSAFSEQMVLNSKEKEKKILQLESEIRDLKSYILPEIKPDLTDFSEIIHSPEGKFRDILDLVNRIKSDDIPVLICGETGTGKEIIARAIHKTSRRETKPFVAVNCGALTETLLESELFGHEKGSFTGAFNRRQGRFEIADGGTIFLDEITETSPSFQVKLLRILQEGIFERVGSEKSIQVNVRIIAATNRNIESEIANGRFRADLFYRLNGFPIYLPPLRKREEDIPLLITHFVKKYGKNLVKEISDQTLTILKEYDWPGNVRELENIIHRAVIFAQSENRHLIRLSDIPEEITKKQVFLSDSPTFVSLDMQILDCLRSFDFSHSAISQTAKVLGDRDRGTITEYFRGLCFQYLVQANFDIDRAVKNISGTLEKKPNERVRKKMENYLQNLPEISNLETVHQEEVSQLPPFKGLPKKYHDYLIAVIQHYGQENSE